MAQFRTTLAKEKSSKVAERQTDDRDIAMSDMDTSGVGSTSQDATDQDAKSKWTFLSNHAHVLICLAGNPTQRLRDVAEEVHITERAVQKIVADLEESGVLLRQREGRRNRYVINPEVHLRHQIESHCTVGNLIDMILDFKPGVKGDSKKRAKPFG